MSGESELCKPEFWATHYHELVGDEDRDSGEVIQAIFRFAEQELEDYYFTLLRPETEARYLSLAVMEGFSLGVQYVDCGEDGTEVRYSIKHADWNNWELLGYDSPHFALPVFRWAEISRIAQVIEGRSADEAATAVLLLFPATYLSMSDDPSEVEHEIARHWDRLSLPHQAVEEGLIRRVVERQTVSDINWKEDSRLGWITDGHYSFRNPQTLMATFKLERFARMASFLKALERSVAK